MSLKERKRKHDDAHLPMQGRGKRANKRKAAHENVAKCEACGKYPAMMAHICDESLRNAKREKCKHDEVLISDSIATCLFSATCLACGKSAGGYPTMAKVKKALEGAK